MSIYIYPQKGISKKLFDKLNYILNDKELALNYLSVFEVLFKEEGEKIRNKTLEWVESKYNIENITSIGFKCDELKVFPEIENI